MAILIFIILGTITNIAIMLPYIEDGNIILLLIAINWMLHALCVIPYVESNATIIQQMYLTSFVQCLLFVLYLLTIY